MTDCARAFGAEPAAAAAAWSLKRFPIVNPSVPTTPVKRNSRRLGRQRWSGLLHQEGTNGLLIGGFGFFAEFRLNLTGDGRSGRGFYAKNVGENGRVGGRPHLSLLPREKEFIGRYAGRITERCTLSRV